MLTLTCLPHHYSWFVWLYAFFIDVRCFRLCCSVMCTALAFCIILWKNPYKLCMVMDFDRESWNLMFAGDTHYILHTHSIRITDEKIKWINLDEFYCAAQTKKKRKNKSKLNLNSFIGFYKRFFCFSNIYSFSLFFCSACKTSSLCSITYVAKNDFLYFFFFYTWFCFHFQCGCMALMCMCVQILHEIIGNWVQKVTL